MASDEAVTPTPERTADPMDGPLGTLAAGLLSAAIVAGILWPTLDLGWMTDDQHWLLLTPLDSVLEHFDRCANFGIRAPLAQTVWGLVGDPGTSFWEVRAIHVATLVALAFAAGASGAVWGVRWWWAGVLGALTPFVPGDIEVATHLSTLSYAQVALGTVAVVGTMGALLNRPTVLRALVFLSAATFALAARDQGVVVPLLAAGAIHVRGLPTSRRARWIVLGALAATALPFLGVAWVHAIDPGCRGFMEHGNTHVITAGERAARAVAGMFWKDGGHAWRTAWEIHRTSGLLRPEVGVGWVIAAAAFALTWRRSPRATEAVAAWVVLNAALVFRFTYEPLAPQRHLYVGATTTWVLVAVIGLGRAWDAASGRRRTLLAGLVVVWTVIVGSTVGWALDSPCLDAIRTASRRYDAIIDEALAHIESDATTPFTREETIGMSFCRFQPTCSGITAGVQRRSDKAQGWTMRCKGTDRPDERIDVWFEMTPGAAPPGPPDDRGDETPSPPPPR